MESNVPQKRFLNINTAILIKGCRQNDIQSQEQLYKLYYPDMIKICCRYANDMDGAGLIYNNAMLKVFKGIHKYVDEGKLGGWIKTIVVNCCIDYCKSGNTFNNTTHDIAVADISILPDVMERLSGKDIQRLIAQLPRATGTVFNLYIYEGFTHKQIAGQLNISEGTSKWHLSEAKKLLKIKLENISETEIKTNAAV